MRGGHEVHLVCQDRDPFALDWVDAAGDWDGRARWSSTSAVAPPRATVYRPDIGGLLPFYVADRYEGIEARPFPELSDEELDRYLDANVAAVREVVERARPDVALANHLVMGPVILARALAGVPYAVKIHGSALEYTVKPHRRASGRTRPRGSAGAAACWSARATRPRACGRRWTTRAARPHAARPAGRGRRALHAARAGRGARAGRAARRLRGARARTPATGSSFDRDPREAVAAPGHGRAR